MIVRNDETKGIRKIAMDKFHRIGLDKIEEGSGCVVRICYDKTYCDHLKMLFKKIVLSWPVI